MMYEHFNSLKSYFPLTSNLVCRQSYSKTRTKSEPKRTEESRQILKMRYLLVLDHARFLGMEKLKEIRRHIIGASASNYALTKRLHSSGMPSISLLGRPHPGRYANIVVC